MRVLLPLGKHADQRPVVPPKAIGTSGFTLLPRAMCESMVLWQSMSALMSHARVIKKGHASALVLDCWLNHCAEMALTLAWEA
jgi:hypothetical protein